jgi:hypothetical protein
VTTVGLGKRALVRAGGGNVLGLIAGGSSVALFRVVLLGGAGMVINSAGSAVVRGVIWILYDVLVDDLAVDVGGVDVGFIHTHDSGVVSEFVAAPLTTGEADAAVTVSIVDAAVVADVLTPVAVIEAVLSVIPTPIRRGPECTLVGSGNPGAGNPVVAAVVVVAPVAGCPHEIWLRADGLLIFKHGGRSESDVDADANLGTSGESGEGYEQG